MEKIKKIMLACLAAVLIFLVCGAVWGGLIFIAVNICFGCDFSVWKEILLGGIFQTSLVIIRETFTD